MQQDSRSRDTSSSDRWGRDQSERRDSSSSYLRDHQLLHSQRGYGTE